MPPPWGCYCKNNSLIYFQVKSLNFEFHKGTVVPCPLDTFIIQKPFLCGQFSWCWKCKSLFISYFKTKIFLCMNNNNYFICFFIKIFKIMLFLYLSCNYKSYQVILQSLVAESSLKIMWSKMVEEEICCWICFSFRSKEYWSKIKHW